ncbi:MAG: hypothetical protein ACJAYR_000217 [Sneathiella sp.]|jgi:hypothetical protein
MGKTGHVSRNPLFDKFINWTVAAIGTEKSFLVLSNFIHRVFYLSSDIAKDGPPRLNFI